MSLREYQRKRQFQRTPEPSPARSRQKTHRLRFVVQEHHASQLHYDFRLELDGVLKSWAIPKGPSLNPHDHHLAVQTEDHPFAYRNFEGVIPEHNYGAGNVIVWDEGWYQARADQTADSQKTLRAELKKGHVTFVLHGKKLRGEFALIRLKNAQQSDAWLLVKKQDQYATAGDVLKQDSSVRSHRQVDALGAHGKLPNLTTYPQKVKPWQVRPMLCDAGDAPFNGEDWLFEIKWDGYRAIASKYGADCELYSRNQLDFSRTYAPITEALRQLEHDAILDGEIVVVDRQGKPHFEWLQNWREQPQGEIQYQAFDIVWCNGYDVRTMPLSQRKALLHAVLPSNGPLHYGDHIMMHGKQLFAQLKRRGLEGMVAKKADSRYTEGVRGPNWIKIKTQQRQEVVIGGYTEPRGSRKYLGSLLVGVYKNGQLVFTGHSGGGIPDIQRKQLHAQLQTLERQTSPFKDEPTPNAPVHWVRPQLVCEMSFSEWTAEGLMRHPQFRGLRPDKPPRSVVREATKSSQYLTAPSASSADLPFEPTHLDKLFFPQAHYTKGDLFTYYKAVAHYMLPYMADRPLSLNRMPDGIGGMSFFQKNNPHLPAWVPQADLFSDSHHGALHWIVGGGLETLLYAVQLGSIEINTWNSRTAHLDKPDWLVIDLDPDGVPFAQVIAVAQTVHAVCQAWHIPSFPKTSGQTGLHIYIPTGACYTHNQCKDLAHLIAMEVVRRQPQVTSLERDPAKRRHRIYVDYLQNRQGQTLAAPYSVRPTPLATVSMPLRWNEVRTGLDPSRFTIKTAPARLRRVGNVWSSFTKQGIDLAAVLQRIEDASA